MCVGARVLAADRWIDSTAMTPKSMLQKKAPKISENCVSLAQLQELPLLLLLILSTLEANQVVKISKK